jgi:hypothetical protein
VNVDRSDLPRVVRDPDGRPIAFTQWSWDHIMVERPQLLGDIDGLMSAVASPDFRERDPIPSRERFYQRRVTDRVRWLRVVVDFTAEPAVVVTAFIQRKSPVSEQ